MFRVTQHKERTERTALPGSSSPGSQECQEFNVIRGVPEYQTHEKALATPSKNTIVSKAQRRMPEPHLVSVDDQESWEPPVSDGDSQDGQDGQDEADSNATATFALLPG